MRVLPLTNAGSFARAFCANNTIANNDQSPAVFILDSPKRFDGLKSIADAGNCKGNTKERKPQAETESGKQIRKQVFLEVGS